MSKEKMTCKENNCDGIIDRNTPIRLHIGCVAYDFAYPCSQCGRLHWSDGDPVVNRSGQPAFWEDGGVVLKGRENSDIVV